jgi:hypothetical protein
MAGSFMSSALGGNTSKTVTKNDLGLVIRSSTTNSYSKCLNEIKSNFTDEQYRAIAAAIDKYDRDSFEEKILYSTLYEEDTAGNRKPYGRKFMYIKGDYTFAIFAHLKTLEIGIRAETI